jgi:hypothetical protein
MSCKDFQDYNVPYAELEAEEKVSSREDKRDGDQRRYLDKAFLLKPQENERVTIKGAENYGPWALLLQI